MSKFFSNVLIFFFSFIAAFLFVEILLRFNDQNPWGNFIVDLNEPTINQPDKIKGWDLKPGKYLFEPYSETGKKFIVSVNEDKTRFTGMPPQESLGDIVFIELPTVGKSVNAKDEICVVESVKAASDIYAPVDGEILEVNNNLEGDAEIINQDAENTGWIFKMKISNSNQYDELMTENDYKSFLEQ